MSKHYISLCIFLFLYPFTSQAFIHFIFDTINGYFSQVYGAYQSNIKGCRTHRDLMVNLSFSIATVFIQGDRKRFGIGTKK